MLIDNTFRPVPNLLFWLYHGSRREVTAIDLETKKTASEMLRPCGMGH